MAIRVRMVWDGTTFTLPPELGVPRADQMQGSPLDQLVEISGRCCYDSCGKGRSSEDYHTHIREVGHTSVWRHAVITVEFSEDRNDRDWTNQLMLACLNRPGVFVDHGRPRGARVTINLCSVREWIKWTNRLALVTAQLHMVGDMNHHFKNLMPTACSDLKFSEHCSSHVVKPETPDEIWASLFFTGVSRSLSHELVRHSWQACPSQRSTRYCSEDESPWIPHPAMNLTDKENMDWVMYEARERYGRIVLSVEKRLLTEGLDKLSARKQARAAAARVLGHGLETELIFSASLSAWQKIFRQRISPHADWEIRDVMIEARDILAARWPEHFA